MPKMRHDPDERCWWVPVSEELVKEGVSLEPVRIEIRDGEMWITQLEKVNA